MLSIPSLFSSYEDFFWIVYALVPHPIPLKQKFKAFIYN